MLENDSANTAAPTRSDELWTPREVASYLKVSRSWVYQKAESGMLPVIRMPGSSLLRFMPDVIRAFATGEVKTVRDFSFHRAQTKR